MKNRDVFELILQHNRSQKSFQSAKLCSFEQDDSVNKINKRRRGTNFRIGLLAHSYSSQSQVIHNLPQIVHVIILIKIGNLIKSELTVILREKVTGTLDVSSMERNNF